MVSSLNLGSLTIWAMVSGGQGTTLAFCMSTVAASFPEFIMLKQVMTWKLLAIIFSLLLMSFTLVGWLINMLYIF